MIDERPWDYQRALQAIWERSAYDRGFISNPFWGDKAAGLGLRRTAALLEMLGHPDRRYAIIHVAGSKGKGSTCAFAAAILQAAGYRTGRYTSPHLHTFRERIAVDGIPVSERVFAALTQRVTRAAERLQETAPDLGEVTAFELTTVMALQAFADAGCTAAVVEVGMGGLLDSTNVVDPAVAVITRLDFEHTRVLGDTIEEIARNKAGIIKPGRPVVVAPQPDGALPVIAAAAREAGSDLLAGGPGGSWHITGTWREFTATGPWGAYRHLQSGLAGDHQTENAGAAITAAWLLNSIGVTIDERAIRQGLAGTVWPGRYEVIERPGQPRIVLDGAHTPAAAAALARTVAGDSPGRKAVVVLALLADKDPAALIASLAPVTSIVVATRARSPRALDAAPVARAAEAAGLTAATADGVPAALRDATQQAGPGGLVLVTGSLTTVAEAREALGLAIADPSQG